MKLLFMRINKCLSRNQTNPNFRAEIYASLTRSAILNLHKIVIALFFLPILQSCSATKQIDVYNPFPDRAIHIEQKNNSCADSYEIKLWYFLYGSYPINSVNVREIFPSADYTYSLEQNATVGDKVLSFFTGLFFSISRKTLIVKTCQPIAKITETHDSEFSNEESDVMDSEFSSKMEELEKEVSYLKGKISGIETTVGWMNQPVSQELSQKQENNIDLPLDKIKESMNRDSEPGDAKMSHHYILFRRGSSNVTKNEFTKLISLKSLFKQPWSKILIIGSSDTTGNFKSNLSLSWKRANEVKRLFVDLGIDSGKILISGAGERRQKEILSFNEDLKRRVDIYLVKGEVE